MIEDIVGNNGTRFIIAAGAVALGLLCLVAVLWFIRNRPSSPFIRGGKNRQPRLAVLDAAAIDTRRRLVLVRRDDVEHLIMIGGPTDVVIESRIATQARPVPQVTASAPEATTGRPERRAQLPAEPGAAPVSGMGQVLYGEDTGTSAVVRPTASVRARPETLAAPSSAAAPRQPLPERKAVAEMPPRPQPVASPGGTPVATASAKSPEDILEAARSRVLAANQTTAQPRPLPQTPTTIAPGPQGPQDQQDPVATEFERILDAEISGDLGKLTAEDVRVDGDRRTPAPSPATAVRQEPRLSNAPGGRTEPTLEDEMNRMLNEIAVGRKN
jgi:hypothetical protein